MKLMISIDVVLQINLFDLFISGGSELPTCTRAISNLRIPQSRTAVSDKSKARLIDVNKICGYRRFTQCADVPSALALANIPDGLVYSCGGT